MTKQVNVRYLTGFTGSNGAVLVRPDGSALLATDGRYETQALAESPDVDVVVARSVGVALVEMAAAEGLGTVGLERHHVTLAAFDGLTGAADGSVEFVDVGQPVEALRVRKDAAEIEAITRACAITDEVFAAVLRRLRPGVSELEISWAMTQEMQSRGSSPAFESIVAFGPNSAMPHHRPTDRALAAGDLVKLDFGAMADGYHADMTRTVVVGAAAAWQRELHELVARIQAEARAATVPGSVPAGLDEAVRRRIEEAGHEPRHGLGHGVGLEIHEAPFVVPESPDAPLDDGVPVTVEPGIYLPGQGGVRIEDTVLVTAEGAQPLTTSPRELLEV